MNFSWFKLFTIWLLQDLKTLILKIMNKTLNVGKNFFISKYSLKKLSFYYAQKRKKKKLWVKKNIIKICIHKNLSYLFCQNLFLFPEKNIREIKISQKKIKRQNYIYPKFLWLFFLLFLVDRFVFYFKANWPWDDASVLLFF